MSVASALPPFEELYAAHWRFVLQLLPNYGIPPDDHDDLAQQVWTTVHVRQASYQPERHKTPGAWLTGIVRRCSANHRRTVRRRHEVPTEEAGTLVASGGLDPEEAALLRTLEQAIRDPERREAFLLQQRHGCSIAEIAAAQGVSEDAVEWRLHMAREDLKADGEPKKSRAFLGFGTLEALTEALRPRPIPPGRGEELWRRITEQMQQQGGELRDGAGPSSSFPPPAVVLPAALAPPSPALLTLTRTRLAVVVVGAFLGGAVAGMGSLLAWQAYQAARHSRPAPTMESRSAPPAHAPAPGLDVPVSTLSASSAPAASSALAASTGPAASSPPATSSAPSASMASAWLLGRMRRAARAGNFELVRRLAEQHEAQFRDGQDAGEREALRLEAWTQLGRTAQRQ